MPGLIRVSGHAERLAALDVVRHFTDRLVAITSASIRATMPPLSLRNCA